MSPLLRIITVIMSPLLCIITRSIIRNNGFIIMYYRPGQLGDDSATAATLRWSTATPRSEMTWLRKPTDERPNRHLNALQGGRVRGRRRRGRRSGSGQEGWGWATGPGHRPENAGPAQGVNHDTCWRGAHSCCPSSAADTRPTVGFCGRACALGKALEAQAE